MRGFPRHALALLLAFDCYFRVSELLALRPCDVALLSGSLAFRLRATKTGLNQSVIVRRVEVFNLCLSYLLPSDRSSQAPLFPFSASAFRSLFQSGLRHFGLNGRGFVLHSLRHGGATSDYAEGRSMEWILERGRWASVRSARRYIQTGRALFIAANIPPPLLSLAADVSVSLPSFFSFFSSLSQ